MSSQIPLFEQPADSPSKRDLLKAFEKEHGILTHRTKGPVSESSWLALLVPETRADTGGPIPPDWGIFEHIYHCCRLLDEMGFTGYGATELEAVREVCRQREIPFPL